MRRTDLTTEAGLALLWSKVDKNGPTTPHCAGPCWLWLASCNRDGYGNLTVGRRYRPAHIVVYELVVGAVPSGLELDHRCRVRNCVNPSHLEPVTHAVNMARGAHAMKTHCKRGHEYTPENTYIQHGDRRRCRACMSALNRRLYLTKKTKEIRCG